MPAKKKDLVDRIADEMDRQTTFNPLLHALRENDKKNLFKTNVTTYYHKTGYALFDYYFGSVINLHNELGEIVKQESRVGQAAGTVNMIIGATGSAKTTLAIQLSSNIIRPFKNSNVIHYDCEQRIDISRIENITKLHPSDFEEGGRYILKSESIGLDIMQESIVQLYAAKMKIKDQISYHTGQLNEFGKEIVILEPTVVIVDSVTAVINETFSVDNSKELSSAMELQSNTEGARSAKSMRGFLKDILPLCKEANIIIYFINHINMNMSMNAFIPPSKQQNFLKVDESIPGGRGLLYYPFNIIKLTAKPGDDFVEDSDGFTGHMVMVEPIKSSSNQSGNNSKNVSFEMVFSFKHGFDPLRSLIVYGRERGIIEGTKNRMKFKDDPSFTFSLKDINKEKDDKPIWEGIKLYIFPELETHLSFIEPEEIKFDHRSMDY